MIAHRLRRRKTITNLVLASIAVALGFIAQGYLVRRELQDGLLVYAVAVALFVVAVHRQRNHRTLSAETILPAARPATLYMIAGFVLIALGALATGLALQRFGDGSDMTQGWNFHLIGILAFIAGVYVLEIGRADKRLRAYVTWREAALLLAIVAIGAFMRFWHFNSWPPGTWYDEADNALHVIGMIQDPSYRPVFVASTNLPAHFLYLIYFSFKLFGISTSSIRVVTACFGLATIVAAYFLGRELFNRRLAFFLAFLLAVSRWDVNFSRIGLHGVSTPLFELLVLFFLLRGLRTQSRIDFAWAGLFAGLGLCFYAPFRLFPFVVIVFLLRLVLTDRSFIRRNASNLAVMGLLATIVFSPVIQYARDHNEEFWARTNKVSIFTSQPSAQTSAALGQNAGAHLLMFNYHGDPNGRHNLPGEPELDFATSALFVLGIGYSLYRFRNPRCWLLLAWLGIMLLGGILSLPFEAPQSLRAIGTLPAAYTLAIVPLALVQFEFIRSFPRRGGTLFIVLLIALAGWIGWSNYNTYFNLQANNFSSWSAYSTRETLMAQEINRLDPGYIRYFTPVLTNHLTTEFIAPGLTEQTPFDPAQHLPFREAGSAGVAVFIDADSLDLIPMLQSYYPSLEIRRFGQGNGGEDVLALALITRNEVEAIQGLPARYYRSGGGAIPLYRQDATIDFDWKSGTPIEFPFDVEWRGVLVAPGYGVYGLRLVGSESNQADVRLDGVPLLGGGQPLERRISLAKGRHELWIRGHAEGPGTLRLEWQRPEGLWETVPRQVLYGPPVTANGLVASFYPNDRWEGPPARVQIDPEVSFYFHLIPLPRPYSVEWTGQIEVPVTGSYELGIECRDAAWLSLDGVEVLVSQTPDRVQQAIVDLTAGRHDLRLRFVDRTDHSHIYLSWTAPGDMFSIIPNRNLFISPGAGWEPAE